MPSPQLLLALCSENVSPECHCWQQRQQASFWERLGRVAPAGLAQRPGFPAALEVETLPLAGRPVLAHLHMRLASLHVRRPDSEDPYLHGTRHT